MPGRKSFPKGRQCWLWPTGDANTKAVTYISTEEKLGVKCQGKKNLVTSDSGLSPQITSHGSVPKYHKLSWFTKKKKKNTSMKSYTYEYLQVTPFTIKLHRSRKSTHWETCAVTIISPLVLVLAFFSNVWSMSTKNGSLSVLKLIEEKKVYISNTPGVMLHN